VKSICFVTYEFPNFTPFGGIAFYYEKITRLLQINGYSVTVVTSGNESYEIQECTNVKIVFIESLDIKSFNINVSAWFKHTECYFDILELPTYGTTLFHELRSGELRKLAKHITVRFHGFSLLSGLYNVNESINVNLYQLIIGKYFLNRFAIRFLKMIKFRFYGIVKLSYRELIFAQSSDSVSTTSNLLARYLNIYRPKIKLHVFPNPNQFEIEQSLEKNWKKIKILYVNRIQIWKGFDLFVQMAKTVSSINYLNRDVDFICYGSKKLWNGNFDIDALSNIIEFRGHQSSSVIIEAMKGSNIVVVPSRFESFSNVAIEAMMTSCLLIVSSNVGICEYIRHGENGFVFDSSSRGDLERCILKVLSMDQTELNKVSKNAFLTAKNLAQNKELLKYYDNLT
jgi:glycosyltransferase involved in cell wall biosynthesis